MAAPQTDKRTASQRIDDLERALMALYQSVNNIGRDGALIKNALKLMDNKIDSIMKASVAGDSLTDENVSRYMKEIELEELKGKVANLVTQGFLVATDTVGEKSFLVGSECEPDAADGTPGKVIHARLQFTLASLDKEIQEKLKGAKVGDIVRFKEDALVFKVQEAYNIVNPAPPAPLSAEAPKAEATEQKPAAEQSSSDAEATQASPEAAQSNSGAGN